MEQNGSEDTGMLRKLAASSRFGELLIFRRNKG
jgi:hypothetical protein